MGGRSILDRIIRKGFPEEVAYQQTWKKWGNSSGHLEEAIIVRGNPRNQRSEEGVWGLRNIQELSVLKQDRRGREQRKSGSKRSGNYFLWALVLNEKERGTLSHCHPRGHSMVCGDNKLSFPKCQYCWGWETLIQDNDYQSCMHNRIPWRVFRNTTPVILPRDSYWF